MDITLFFQVRKLKFCQGKFLFYYEYLEIGPKIAQSHLILSLSSIFLMICYFLMFLKEKKNKSHPLQGFSVISHWSISKALSVSQDCQSFFSFPIKGLHFSHLIINHTDLALVLSHIAKYLCSQIDFSPICSACSPAVSSKKNPHSLWDLADLVIILK